MGKKNKKEKKGQGKEKTQQKTEKKANKRMKKELAEKGEVINAVYLVEGICCAPANMGFVG